MLDELLYFFTVIQNSRNVKGMKQEFILMYQWEVKV